MTFKPRLPRRKAVTIALGFLCSDGIVLTSDRQMTVDGGLKYDTRKLSYMTGLFHGTEFTLMSAYAGDPEAAQVMRTEIRERLGKEIAESNLAGFQADKARKVLEKIFNNKHSKHLQMLIGIRFISGERCLFRTSGKKVLRARTEHIGSGDSSALRFVCELLLPQQQTVIEAQILGSYIVSVANRYVDGCSGGPDIVSVNDAGMISDNQCGIWSNQQEKFLYCENTIGTALRELLLAGGDRKIVMQAIKPRP